MLIFKYFFWKGIDKARSIRGSFVNELFSRITVVSSKLGHYKKRDTITNRDTDRCYRMFSSLRRQLNIMRVVHFTLYCKNTLATQIPIGAVLL
jgi:hypothetical protein